MFGAIIGDIVGSTFENQNHRSPFFELFRPDARFTDDTVATVAIADTLLKYYNEGLTHDNMSNNLRLWCITYLNRGFGSMFYQWICNGVNKPYDSYGNGALMRISPVAMFAVAHNIQKEQALEIAEKLTVITHNHPQAIECVRIYISLLYDFLLYHVTNKKLIPVEEAKKIIIETLEKNNFKIPDKIVKYRIKMEFDLTCYTSLEVALAGILQTENFDDVLYQIVSVGGDSDTYCAIAGPLAEAIYSIPKEHMDSIKKYFRVYDADLLFTLGNLYSEYFKVLDTPNHLELINLNED